LILFHIFPFLFAGRLYLGFSGVLTRVLPRYRYIVVPVSVQIPDMAVAEAILCDKHAIAGFFRDLFSDIFCFFLPNPRSYISTISWVICVIDAVGTVVCPFVRFLHCYPLIDYVQIFVFVLLIYLSTDFSSTLVFTFPF